MQEAISVLAEQKVAVVAAAGNSYADHRTQSYGYGIQYPSLIHPAFSVGATYTKGYRAEMANIRGSGIKSNNIRDKVIAGFSQRLHHNATKLKELNQFFFAPMIISESAGVENDWDTTFMTGTSSAAPVFTAFAALIQKQYLLQNGRLPSIDILQSLISEACETIYYGDDEDDELKFQQALPNGFLAESSTHIEIPAVEKTWKYRLLPLTIS
jgi:subtilisin family serine protease